MKQKLIVVAGPTASGKTRLAIDIAKKVNGEIIGADSMQIYKYMNIGTAKPTEEELSEARHHLIDFLEPDADFSVADYVPLAHKTIAETAKRGHIPILCGGTGLYINSVVNDIDFGENGSDPRLREELNRLARERGGEYLLETLNEFDPVSAQRLHPNNMRRIIRAIEFYRVTGTTISSHQEMTRLKQSRYEPLMLFIDTERSVLYERINRRVDLMAEEGLFDEVRSLTEMGFTRDLNSMKGIGYKEVLDYFDGIFSKAETIELIKQNSRRYAKRQLTWFRRDERIRRLDAKGDVSAEGIRMAEEFLEK